MLAERGLDAEQRKNRKLRGDGQNVAHHHVCDGLDERRHPALRHAALPGRLFRNAVTNAAASGGTIASP